ncbi:MAG: hypothetical protein ABIM98_01795 [candidate division WOR-3 bacterium]
METLFISLIFVLPIKQIEIKGITPFLEKKCIEILKKFENLEASKENLDKLTEELSLFFLKEGYPNARIRFTGFEEYEDGLKIFINVSDLNYFIINDIIFDKNIKTKKKIFLHFFNLIQKPFNIQDFEKGKEKLKRFGFINVRNFELRKFGGLNYLYLDIHEKPSNSFESFLLYDNKRKTFAGKIETEINNIFGDLRSFFLRWERFSEGKADFEVKYTEPFIFNFDISISPHYNLFQRDSLYIKENLGLKISYFFERVKFSLIYDYFEEIPFLKTSRFISSSGSEIVIGEKSFLPTNIYFFSLRGILLKGKGISHKAITDLILMKNFMRYFYSSFEIYSGFLNFLKDTIISEYFFLGGFKYPRGYREEEFIAKLFFTFVIENYINFKNFSFFLFYDYSKMKLISEEYINKIGYGFGFSGFEFNTYFKISFAFPYKESLQSTKVHFFIKNYF